LHLSRAEKLADDFHAIEQKVVDDVERLVGFHRLVEMRGEIALLSVDDVLLEFLFDAEGLVLVFGKHGGGSVAGFGEEADEMGEGVEAFLAAIVD